MLWKHPHVIKVYEALGILADDRIKLTGDSAEVLSSNRNKTYKVVYNAADNTIVANDSGSYWQRYISYPSIAYLLATGKISYDKSVADELKGIKWKNLNDAHKHNYPEVIVEVEKGLKDPKKVAVEAERILKEVIALKLKLPPKLIRPAY